MAQCLRKRHARPQSAAEPMSLDKWFKENWVDIGSPKKNGKYHLAQDGSKSKRKYPKCVPAAKAARMTKGQKASAVRRKRSKAQGVGWQADQRLDIRS